MRRNGLHHVSAMAGRARRNLEFHTRVLGLRLVKRTVNFDDPASYHFYYGDELGHPGTLLTYFPWEHLVEGRLGRGETLETGLRVPEGAVDFWQDRLAEFGVTRAATRTAFGETVLPFRDPDGTRLALVGVAGAEAEPARDAPGIPSECSIRGLHNVVLLLEETEPTGAILSHLFGFAETARDSGRLRMMVPGMPIGGIVDLETTTDRMPGRLGRGSVHHVAFRAADDVEQVELVTKLVQDHGLGATDQKDRGYFRSVYFREPGGVLFEIATDGPGFTVDEPASALGDTLKLPGALEERRRMIEAALPDLD